VLPGNLQHVWELAVLTGVCERESTTSAAAGVRAVELRNPVAVTLCRAIGRGSTGRAGRPVGLGLYWRANVEQTWPRNGLHEVARNGYNPRSKWVRRQGLEPRTRRLRVCCPVFRISALYLRVYDATCGDMQQLPRIWCRFVPAATGPYRDIRATTEQPPMRTGLDHHGRGPAAWPVKVWLPATRYVLTASRVPPKRPTRFVIPAGSARI